HGAAVRLTDRRSLPPEPRAELTSRNKPRPRQSCRSALLLFRYSGRAFRWNVALHRSRTRAPHRRVKVIVEEAVEQPHFEPQIPVAGEHQLRPWMVAVEIFDDDARLGQGEPARLLDEDGEPRDRPASLPLGGDLRIVDPARCERRPG